LKKYETARKYRKPTEENQFIKELNPTTGNRTPGEPTEK
jgi:hypothetical protein